MLVCVQIVLWFDQSARVMKDIHRDVHARATMLRSGTAAGRSSFPVQPCGRVDMIGTRPCKLDMG